MPAALVFCILLYYYVSGLVCPLWKMKQAPEPSRTSCSLAGKGVGHWNDDVWDVLWCAVIEACNYVLVTQIRIGTVSVCFENIHVSADWKFLPIDDKFKFQIHLRGMLQHQRSLWETFEVGTSILITARSVNSNIGMVKRRRSKQSKLAWANFSSHSRQAADRIWVNVHVNASALGAESCFLRGRSTPKQCDLPIESGPPKETEAAREDRSHLCPARSPSSVSVDSKQHDDDRSG